MAKKRANADRDRQLDANTEAITNLHNHLIAFHDALEYMMDVVLTDEQRSTLVLRAIADREEGKPAPRILVPK